MSWLENKSKHGLGAWYNARLPTAAHHLPQHLLGRIPLRLQTLHLRLQFAGAAAAAVGMLLLPRLLLRGCSINAALALLPSALLPWPLPLPALLPPAVLRRSGLLLGCLGLAAFRWALLVQLPQQVAGHQRVRQGDARLGRHRCLLLFRRRRRCVAGQGAQPGEHGSPLAAHACLLVDCRGTGGQAEEQAGATNNSGGTSVAARPGNTTIPACCGLRGWRNVSRRDQARM